MSYPRTHDNAGSARHDKGIWGNEYCEQYILYGKQRIVHNEHFLYKGIGKIPPREGFLIMHIHREMWIYERDDSSHFGIESREYAAGN